MICPQCKLKPATYHLHDMERKQKSIHLCEDCKKNFSLVSLFCENLEKIKEQHAHENIQSLVQALKLISIQESDTEIHKMLEEKNSCPKCGNTASNILKKGIFGCQEDFIYFKKIVERILEETQGTSQHMGKKCLHNENEKISSKIITLEFDLKKAIQNENYELASQITKKINSLKTL